MRAPNLIQGKIVWGQVCGVQEKIGLRVLSTLFHLNISSLPGPAKWLFVSFEYFVLARRLQCVADLKCFFLFDFFFQGVRSRAWVSFFFSILQCIRTFRESVVQDFRNKRMSLWDICFDCFKCLPVCPHFKHLHSVGG